MAGSTSKHKIGTSEPSDWHHRNTIDLQLQYFVDHSVDPAIYTFSYRIQNTYPDSSLPRDLLDRFTWSGPIVVKDINKVLNILIWEDSIVNATVYSTPEYPLSWSLETDAVMTSGPHSDLYGQLLYDDNGKWVPREQFSGAECLTIRYKAKHKKAPKSARHKFSYNVVAKGLDGSPDQPLEVDPDIRNPPVGGS